MGKHRLKNKLYDSEAIDWKNLLFSKKALRALLIPIMIEQFLTSFMGMVDTIMVTRVGSAAISAVSLTDSINVLIILMFEALAAGGTIICSQYIGHNNEKKANEAASQVFIVMLFISAGLGALCFFLRGPLLRLVFGTVEPAVMSYSLTYMMFTAVSFPFLAMFQAGAAFFRAAGNSRFPMIVSVISNALNIAGNAIFIFLFHWGVMGAALATLVSRIFCAIVILIYLRKPKQVIVLRKYLVKPNWSMIGKIMGIGVPAGIENGMFQFGKLAIQSSVSTLGTTAIAANAMTIILENLNGIAAMAIGIGLMTVVGQAIGAGRKEEAKYYIIKLTGYAEVVVIVSCVIVMILAKPVMIASGMEAESMRLCLQMMWFVTFTKPISWVLSFIPPYGLRAAGDVRFSMITSMSTMWLCRVAMVTVLIRVFEFGPIAVWIGMACDWTIRGIIFTARYFSGKWLKFRIAD